MNTNNALTRVSEARDALDEARTAMKKAEKGLSAVEKMAEKADPTRRHPVRTGAILLLLVALAVGALIGLRNIADS